MYTLTKTDVHAVAISIGMDSEFNGRVEQMGTIVRGAQGGTRNCVAFRKSKRAQTKDDDETWVDDGLANTMNGFDTGDTRTTHAVAFTQNQREEVRELGDLAGALSGHGTHQTNYIAETPVVRRLTPMECERLQGFPDGWTQIGTDKPTADTHRYKQLGNAVTVNVAEWIARRALAHLSKER